MILIKDPSKFLADEPLKCKAIPSHETGLVTKGGWAG
jgi:hypothetical protein